ncbi:hypothetical protein [Nocardioides antri]|uniref:DUF1795 domain-containing protein n=1 Tax=Nocardioides antri TaxID=2607659 RepID=A0A5B1M8P7_9ACTN|nr:hypothetical protein [Nocardioides antri]KAA1429173.1 hypothetical protein F0U47_02985 [Nocardioides antri]
MGLLDDRLKGRRGVVVLIVTGVIAAVAAAAIVAWSDDTEDAAPNRPRDKLVEVVSRAGDFAVSAPDVLVGDQVGRGVKLTSQNDDLVITVAPSSEAGLRAGHAATLDVIRGTYPEMRVDREVGTTMGGLEARRSVGVVRRARGDQVLFSVTTAAQGRRTWSVVLFAARDIDPARLERFYQPVLDGFRVLR